MKAHTWADIFSLVLVLALVMILVRPSSLAPAFLQHFGAGVAGLVQFAVSG